MKTKVLTVAMLAAAAVMPELALAQAIDFGDYADDIKGYALSAFATFAGAMLAISGAVVAWKYGKSVPRKV